jgi:hypothetical protein
MNTNKPRCRFPDRIAGIDFVPIGREPLQPLKCECCYSIVERILSLTRVISWLLRASLLVWAPDAALRQKILVSNPARLYGF